MAYPVSDVLNSLRMAAAQPTNGYAPATLPGEHGTPGGADTLAGAAPPPSPPGSLDITNTPDYEKLLLNDPAYLLAKQGADRQNLISSQLRAAIVRNALTAYGGVPDMSRLSVVDPSGASWLDSDVDPVTRNLAAQNTAAGTSQLGQLGQAHDTNLANLRALLASHGILGGGQDALLQREEGRRHAGALDSAQQSLFDTLSKAQRDYLSEYTGGQSNLSTILSQVADRLQQSNAFDPTTFKASLDSGFTSSGQPVYKDGNGNYWTSDGKPVGKDSLSTTPSSPSNVVNFGDLVNGNAARLEAQGIHNPYAAPGSPDFMAAVTAARPPMPPPSSHIQEQFAAHPVPVVAPVPPSTPLPTPPPAPIARSGRNVMV